jgi:hypothetical protein
MKDKSESFRVTIIRGDFSCFHASNLASFARPVSSVVAASTACPLRPIASIRAPCTGSPLWIDSTNTSRVPSFACFTMKPRSVIRISRVSWIPVG